MIEDDYQLSDIHKAILDERLAAHNSDRLSGSSWKEIKSRMGLLK